MGYGQYIKEIGRGPQGARDLTRDDAHMLYAAMLDGGIPDLELGAVLLAMRMKGEAFDEMLGFLDALAERTNPLAAPEGRVRPVVLPSYNGSRKEANLTPLLALLLRRFGIPVLVHGLIEGYGRVTTAQIFRELSIVPACTPSQASAALDAQGLAFVPLSVISPGLHQLLSLRARLGVRNSAHSLVKLLNPFPEDAVLVAPATHPEFLELTRDLLLARNQRGVVFRGTEGEPFANPKRRPRLEYVHDGVCTVLFEAEHESLRSLPNLPEVPDACGTAQWIQRVVDKQIPLPKPLADLLASLLYATGFAEDLNQAKALVAVETAGSGCYA